MRRFVLLACQATAVSGFWLAMNNIAMAQSGGSDEAPVSFVLPAFVVIAFSVMNLLAIIRSTGRAPDVEAREYKAKGYSRGDAQELIEKRKRRKRTGPELHEGAQRAMLYGIVSLFIFVMGPVALIMGLNARKEIANDRRLTGDTQALLGIILGAAGFLIGLIGIILIALSYAGGGS